MPNRATEVTVESIPVVAKLNEMAPGRAIADAAIVGKAIPGGAISHGAIPDWAMGAVLRLLAKPVNYCVVLVVLILCVLPLDTVASQPVQLLLGVGATAVLLMAMLGVEPEQRVRVVIAPRRGRASALIHGCPGSLHITNGEDDELADIYHNIRGRCRPDPCHR